LRRRGSCLRLGRQGICRHGQAKQAHEGAERTQGAGHGGLLIQTGSVVVSQHVDRRKLVSQCVNPHPDTLPTPKVFQSAPQAGRGGRWTLWHIS
jgi:hypothetical protein